MKWTPGGQSRNLEDKRAETGGRRGGFGGVRIGVGGFILLLVGSVIFQTDLFALLGDGGIPAEGPADAQPSSEEEEQEVSFISFVLDDVQASWKRLLPTYREAQLVLFRDAAIRAP